MIRDFYIKNFFILGGTHLGSFVTFLSQIIILRNLNYNEVSITLSLIAMFGLINIPISVVTKIIVNYLSEEYKISKENYLEAENNSKKIIVSLILIILIFYSFLFPVIFKYLKIENPYFLYLFIPLTIICNMYFNVYLSILQARQEFIKYVFMSNLNFLLRLMMLALLIFIVSFNQYTVLYTIPLAILFTLLIFCIFNEKKNFFKIFIIKNFWSKSSLNLYKVIYKSLPKVILFSVLFYYLFIDQIIVKNLFPNEINNIYIKTSIISKLVFYLPAPLSIFLLSKNSGLQKNANFYFLSSLALTALISVALFFFIKYFDESISKILLGDSDQINEECLIILMIGMIFYSLINIIVTQLVARTSYKNLLILVLISASFPLTSQFSKNIIDFSYYFTSTIAILFFVSIIFCLKKN